MLVGGSAGSFMHILKLVSELPADFPIPVLIALHRGKQYKSVLKELLQQNTEVEVKEADDKDILAPGKVFIAPADYHLLIEMDNSLSLDVSEPVWYCRPSIDVLFESAVDVFGDAVLSFLFSGANADGANGSLGVHLADGCAMVQNPVDAEFPAMPEAAVNKNAEDFLFESKDINFMVKEIYRIRKSVNNN